MTVSDRSSEIRQSRWIARLIGGRFVLAAAAIVLLAFLAFGSLSLTAGAHRPCRHCRRVLIGEGADAPGRDVGGARPCCDTRRRPAARCRDRRAARSRRSARPRRAGRAFNGGAAAFAPALRRGELGVARIAHARCGRGDPPARSRAARRNASSSTSACRSTAGRRRWSRRSELASAGQQPRPAHRARSLADQARRGDARRLRRQCEP